MMETAKRTPTHPRPYLWTKPQYHALGDMGWFQDARVELVDGEILQMSPITAPHWTGVALAGETLRTIFADGYLVVAQNAFDGGSRSEPEPDIAVLRGKPRDFAQSLPSAAALIVEVSLTTLAYDRTRKAALYACAGINDYWIINLHANQVEVRRDPISVAEDVFGYADLTVYHSGQAIAPLAMPNAAVAIDDLLP